MPSSSPPRRAPRRAWVLTATPAHRGGVQPGWGRPRGQAAPLSPHSPCTHLEDRPGPVAGATLPRGPGSGRAAAAASPRSPWKRGAEPHRGHADLHAEAGTGGDGTARRLRPHGCPPDRRVTALAPPQLLLSLPPPALPAAEPPAALTLSLAARTQYGAILFTDKDEVALRWRHAAHLRPPGCGGGAKGWGCAGPSREVSVTRKVPPAATRLSPAGRKVNMERLRRESFLDSASRDRAQALPVRAGALAGSILTPTRTGGGGERGSEVSARGGGDSSAGRVSPRHGQAPSGPHLLPQAGGRGWVPDEAPPRPLSVAERGESARVCR